MDRKRARIPRTLSNNPLVMHIENSPLDTLNFFHRKMPEIYTGFMAA